VIVTRHSLRNWLVSSRVSVYVGGMIRLPPAPVFWATARTTALAWFVLRGIVGLAGGSPSIRLPVSVFLMLGVAVTAVVDVTVSRERLMLGNLGVGRRVIVGISFLGSGTLEILSAVAVHFLDLGG
jgi:hypothetical protein